MKPTVLLAQMSQHNLITIRSLENLLDFGFWSYMYSKSVDFMHTKVCAILNYIESTEFAPSRLRRSFIDISKCATKNQGKHNAPKLSALGSLSQKNLSKLTISIFDYQEHLT